MINGVRMYPHELEVIEKLAHGEWDTVECRPHVINSLIRKSAILWSTTDGVTRYKLTPLGMAFNAPSKHRDGVCFVEGCNNPTAEGKRICKSCFNERYNSTRKQKLLKKALDKFSKS